MPQTGAHVEQHELPKDIVEVYFDEHSLRTSFLYDLSPTFFPNNKAVSIYIETASLFQHTIFQKIQSVFALFTVLYVTGQFHMARGEFFE